MNKIALLLSCFILSGCGVVNQMQLNSAMEDAQKQIANECIDHIFLSEKEASAFGQYQNAATAQCQGYESKEWPRDKAVKIANCAREISLKYVRPASYSKQAYDNTRATGKKIVESYANGQISWQDTERQLRENFLKYAKGAKQGSYYRFASCQNNIMSQKVLPTYQMKPLLIQYMANLSEFSRNADKKRMAFEDYDIGIQKLQSDFATTEQMVISNNQAQQANAMRELGAALIKADQQSYTAPKPSTIQTTNCRRVGDSVQCTTW